MLSERKNTYTLSAVSALKTADDSYSADCYANGYIGCLRRKNKEIHLQVFFFFAKPPTANN